MIHSLIAFEEGYREEVYRCSEGYPTIGIGTKVGPKGADLSLYQFTVSKKVANAFLDEELLKIVRKLSQYSWYNNLNEDRQAIIESMCYQMGVAGVLKFKRMIKALAEQDWGEAGLQALDSRWARQTPERAERHATVLVCGDLMDVYEGLI